MYIFLIDQVQQLLKVGSIFVNMPFQWDCELWSVEKVTKDSAEYNKHLLSESSKHRHVTCFCG
jgi:hypothetical protein